MANYRPKLKYLFCVANYRSLWPQLSLLRYLNGLDIEPYVLLQDCGMFEAGEPYRLLLNALNLKFVKSPTDLPNDYDVMFSQSVGLDAFEEACLVNSWGIGKTNIKLHNSMSTYNTITNINYTPARVRGHVHGFCMKERRSVDHYRLFLPESDAWFLNVGDPDWDYFQTEEFKNAVVQTKEELGSKVLLLCISFDSGRAECRFWSDVIPWADAKGFAVKIRTHPGCESRVPENLKKYIAPNLHRHVLFAASSHVIAEMASTVVGECMMLQTRVGSYPFAPAAFGYGKHGWFDDDAKWKNVILKNVGATLLSYVPFVHTKRTMEDFLAKDEPYITDAQADVLWGWPKVPCYSSHLFESVEKKMGV
jgi:hypothetical protein